MNYPNSTSFIKGTFRGKYTGALNQYQPAAQHHKTYFVDFLPNAVVTDGTYTGEYSSLSFRDGIRLDSLHEVNIFISSTNEHRGFHVKEVLHDVVITDFKIEGSGKDGLKTFGELSGTIYGTLRAMDETDPVKEPDRVVTIPRDDDSTDDKVLIPASDVIEAPSLAASKKSSIPGCFFRLFQLLAVLGILAFLLRTCNTKNPPAPVPSPVLDSLSQDYRDTMSIQGPSATITVNDWNIPDNDRITIKVNNKAVAEHMRVTKTPKSFQIDALHRGHNILEIIPTAFGKGNVTAMVEVTDLKSTFRFECNIKKGETVKKTLHVR